MLKAYNIVEKQPDLRNGEKKLSNQEKIIAMRYAIDHPTHWKSGKDCTCPACDSSRISFMFERWDVDYCVCGDCGSVFIPADTDVVANYITSSEMRAFRVSDMYQKQEEDLRAISWDEIVSWMEFRIYRYIGKNTGLRVIDYGDKYLGLINRVQASKMSGKFQLRESIFESDNDRFDHADVFIFLNQLKHLTDPVSTLRSIFDQIDDKGILFVSTRLGSGFDILTLKGHTTSIFPYEHTFLPSKKGLEILLDRAGFKILEISTPGTQDVDVVFDNRDRVEEGNFFVRNLIESADDRVKADFQQFLQKSCLSSFAQIVAKKRQASTT